MDRLTLFVNWVNQMEPIMERLKKYNEYHVYCN